MHVVVVVFGRENVKMFESGVGIFFSRKKRDKNHLLHEFAEYFFIEKLTFSRRPVLLLRNLCLVLCFLEYIMATH